MIMFKSVLAIKINTSGNNTRRKLIRVKTRVIEFVVVNLYVGMSVFSTLLFMIIKRYVIP